MKEIMARPAQIIIAKEDTIITSPALGSSLGICFYDAVNHVGGYVHSILPKEKGKNAENVKYVNVAIHKLYAAILEAGADKEKIRAKLIGGAKLFYLPYDSKVSDVGKANIATAYEELHALGIPIAAEDVGDRYGRTIHFHMEDGLVYIETRYRHLYYI